MCAMRALSLVPLLVLAACKSGPYPPDISARTPTSELKTADEWEPPADWSTLPPFEFEQLALTALPDDTLTPLSAETVDALSAALDAMDGTSLRAAVLLARSRSERAGACLLARLQRRVLGPEPWSDAADVVAAAALARFPEPERYWRIVRLVDGKSPHPDIEVRVECACTALRIGVDRVIPFLLRVVRIGTWDGQRDQLDFEPADATAWIRAEAAAALSERAGVPLTYRPDAPIATREREARHLAELLQQIGEDASRDDTRL